MSHTSTSSHTAIRPLSRTDLDAVIAIDQGLSGRSRRGFFTRRLDHAAREPAAFAALAAEHDGRFAGFVLARIEEGEFGATAPLASLDAIGVDLALAGRQGVGGELLGRLAGDLRARGIGELVTRVDWTDARLLAFFSSTGFVLAPRIVLERGTEDLLERGTEDLLERGTEDLLERGTEDLLERGTEAPLPADARLTSDEDDGLRVRSMTRDDLAAIVAIDRRITGLDRSAYYARKLEEVFSEPAIRMSLVAEIDKHQAGFIMARVDFGEFGHTDPEAVMDTIGVDPRHDREGVATALLRQLISNLGALRAELLRTEVAWNRFGLLSFLDRMGFHQHRRLALRLALN